MTSAQHFASYAAAHTKSLGADIAVRVTHLRGAAKSLFARAGHGFNVSEAFTAGGYTLISLYAAGFVVYIAAAY
ncbi:MAG: hypothetical protein CVT73_22520 [Alphaproteobacteria bacterium HGW-Alphaproteobacteria-12]|nr:MAG: hypothetical protein CVT73_22520 [Alphaproteobacteria bacterium HGW-Alphaproteobacteria-12]